MFGTMDMITEVHQYQRERIALAARYRLLSAARRTRRDRRAAAEAAGVGRTVSVEPCGPHETAPAQ